MVDQIMPEFVVPEFVVPEFAPVAHAPVIVIDLQTGMFDGVFEPPLYGADELLARARAVIGWARNTGHKIAFVRHDGPEGDPLAPGMPGWPVAPELGQAADEPTFAKRVGNAFSNPALGEWLKAQDADEVVLLGAQTDQCIAASVAGAIRAGFLVTVVADTHSTVSYGEEPVEEIIARHNREFAAAGVKLVTAAALAGD